MEKVRRIIEKYDAYYYPCTLKERLTKIILTIIGLLVLSYFLNKVLIPYSDNVLTIPILATVMFGSITIGLLSLWVMEVRDIEI